MEIIRVMVQKKSSQEWMSIELSLVQLKGSRKVLKACVRRKERVR